MEELERWLYSALKNPESSESYREIAGWNVLKHVCGSYEGQTKLRFSAVWVQENNIASSVMLLVQYNLQYFLK